MKLSQRLAVVAAPLTLAGAALMLPVSAAQAWEDTDVVAIAVQPTTTQVGTAMTPAVVVNVEEPDQSTPDPDYNGPVTLSYAVNQIGAPEPENNVVTAVGGVASFPDLTFTAVGFGFELRASISDGTISPASAPFNIVGQLLNCPAGQSCQTGTASSSGTSGLAVAAAGSGNDVLTQTGGGFPLLSCTSLGGVVSFTDQNRSKVITVILAKSLVHQAAKKGVKFFGICWGSPTPFTTKDGTTSAFNPANGEFEGLLPDCTSGGPQPCIEHQDRSDQGAEVTTITALPGDPHITY